MKKLYVIFMMFGMFCNQITTNSLSTTLKGIKGDFDTFGKSFKKMWQGMGQGFGGAPTGYIYSCTIVNDTALPLYVGIQEYASFMGAYFKKEHGWSQVEVQPFQQNYSINKKEYYFEIEINEQSKTSGGGPYDTTSDALYIQDCIQLPKDKNSTKMNYFHVYMGKTMQDGSYVHSPQVEYVGFTEPASAKKAKGAITLSSSLTSTPALVVYNSTLEDLVIGYSEQTGAKALKKSDCKLFLTTAQADSYILCNPLKTAAGTELALGTLGVFENNVDETSLVYAMPSKVFANNTYTLEVYQDPGKQQKEVGVQALVSAHNAPSGSVRDVTPVNSVFWNQSVKQLGKKRSKSNLIDLPGQVWVVSKGQDETVMSQVGSSDALQFTLTRPGPGEQRWVYFLYVNETDSVKAKSFVTNFVDQKIGEDVLSEYNKQSKSQYEQATETLSDIFVIKPGAKEKSADSIVVPQKLLIAALQGALKFNNGQIVDSESGVTGYLLGADVFLSQGLSEGDPFYYQLTPSMKTADSIPTSAVNNLLTSKPSGMPRPVMYSSATSTKGKTVQTS